MLNTCWIVIDILSWMKSPLLWICSIPNSSEYSGCCWVKKKGFKQIIIPFSLSCHINVIGNYCSRKDGESRGRGNPEASRAEQTGNETNNQANSAGKKQTKIFPLFPSPSRQKSLVPERLSGRDSVRGIPAWWQLPVTLSAQSALVMDVTRCARCHLHIARTVRFHKAGTCTH